MSKRARKRRDRKKKSANHGNRPTVLTTAPAGSVDCGVATTVSRRGTGWSSRLLTTSRR